MGGGTGEGPEAWPLDAGLGVLLVQAGLGEESGVNSFLVGSGVGCLWVIRKEMLRLEGGWGLECRW